MRPCGCASAGCQPYLEGDRFGIWIEPFNYRAHNGADSANAYTSRAAGATGGIDYLFSDRLVAGIGIGAMESNLSIEGGGGSGNNRTRYLSLYGGYSVDATAMQAVVSYGVHHNHNARTLSLAGGTLTTTTAYGGKSLSAAFELSHRFRLEGYRIQPFASLSYNRLRDDRSVETGAGGLELAVDGRTTRSLVSNVGSRFSRPFQVASGTFTPGIVASWKHEYTGGISTVPTSFAASSDISLPVESRHMVQDRAVLGAELQFVNRSGTIIAARLTGEKGGGYFARGLFGYLRSTF